MKLSREKIIAEAASTGFRPEVFEKVAQLFSLLQSIWSHPFLKNRFVLKGGTALNLFIFDLPRLSVDIDLNYIGSPDKETMLAERPKMDDAIRAVCQREGFMVRQSPTEHAGGKWLLRYESALGQGGNLTVDLNFMFRIPLWPIIPCDSRLVGSYMAERIPVLDVHEIAAGKLCALLSRQAGRDIFDAHQLLTQKILKRDRLRLAFVVYGAMNRKDWRTVSENDIGYSANELMNELVPVLRADKTDNIRDPEIWASRLVEECCQAIAIVLPFTEAEREFLDRILDRGEIEPSLITTDEEMANKIRNHPGLQWKALNVREFKGIQ
ncbi:MAG: nucleotidyl transferase AbiEii/AbiGii toxin family protein [Deltaproteobacteria bacterium]|nr:MAG: nucleotidyl transferase AbiEii/AbiGii toxin family protein [Deltaproteobacteria bacterium]